MKLETHRLRKTFGKHEVIESLDLSIPECRTLALIGPSGSGKSTFLRLLAGLEVPTSGKVMIDGKEIVYREPELIEHRKSLGIVFQSWNLFPHLSALENIVLPLKVVHGYSLEEARSRAFSLLQRFDLKIHADKKPYELSGGQVQRAALIRAVAGQPKMLMLDEPTSALDPLMNAEVLTLIAELKKELSGLVLITHQLNFAKKMADQVIFLDRGKAIEYGPKNQVFEQPEHPLVREYMRRVLAY